MMAGFFDGVRNFVSSLVDGRNPINQNVIYSQALSDETLRQLYRHGIANKIVRLKAGHALNDTLQFDTEADRLFYDARLSRHVKKAAKWMLAFGRGIAVLHHPGDDLSKPLGTVDTTRLMLNVFSGDMVTVGAVVLDLQDVRYLRPSTYTVRGRPIHWSRVVDFRYVEPPELDAPRYRYGGISEFELIYEQLIADGIVQRASPRIIEKASTLFYKIRGFKDAMRSGQDQDMINYFQQLENVRGLFAAGLIDQEDELEIVSQAISNLAEADQITLRRLAMVTSIPLAMLVGENVKGLNSTGDNERQVFQDTIEALQSEYLIDPINELMGKCGMGAIKFRDNQGDTAASRIAYDVQAVAVAEKLTAMGEDARGYLIDKDVIKPDAMADWFPPDDGVDDDETFADSDFDESKIERDESGKFGSGGSKKKESQNNKEESDTEGSSKSEEAAAEASGMPPGTDATTYDGGYVSWSEDEEPVYNAEGEEIGSEEYILIDKVFVEPEKRGQGLARKMMEETLLKIRKESALPIRLAAYPDPGTIDMDDLVDFYESVGFEVINTDGHAVIMEWDG